MATVSRKTKFRQAAFVYLHVAILYEAGTYAMAGHGLLPDHYGPPWLWMVLGAVVAGLVFVGLLFWQNVWLARVVWAVHGLRLPALVNGAFLAGGDARVLPSLYLTALVVVMINLWMLARAGWDL